jgi:hypothetical protein
VYALFCFALDRRLALTGLADGLATLGLSYVLVTLFGVAGAPIGAIVGVLLVSGPLNIAALSRETGVERWGVLTTLGPWLWRFLLIAVIVGVAGAWLQPSSFVLLALLGGAAATLYTVVVAPPVLRSPAGAYLRPLLARLKGTGTNLTSRKGDRRLSVTP